MNEFDFITENLASLAGPEGLGLKDDAANWTPASGCDAVITMDTMCEGVHFPHGKFDAELAQKLIRVNVSDLTAKGADPAGYFLSLGLPSGVSEHDLADFCAGLSKDQDKYGLKLWGGDTVHTGGLSVLTLTMIGTVPSGEMVGRSGAKIGDIVCVTGSIGGGFLGLAAEQGRLTLSGSENAALLSAYHLPEPPYAIRSLIRKFASAALDISDGLAADAGHIAKTSGVKLALNLAEMPTLEATQTWLGMQSDKDKALSALASGGDDYQSLICTAPENFRAFAAEAKAAGIGLTKIGSIKQGQGVVCYGENDRPIHLSKSGYTHF